MTIAIRPSAVHGLRLILALLILNGLLSFTDWWPTPAVMPDRRIAPEFIVWWCLLLVWITIRGLPGRKALVTMAAVYLLLVLGRYLDVTAPSLFGRAINLYWDVPQLPRFLLVTVTKLPLWLTATALAAATLFIWGLLRLIQWSMTCVAQWTQPRARAPWIWCISLMLLALAAANYAGVRATWPYVSKPVIPTYWHQATLIHNALSADRLAATLPVSEAITRAMARPEEALAGLRGQDVMLIFLESFGAVLYDRPVARQAGEEGRRLLQSAIDDSGRLVASAFFRSPTIGGASDLAHMSVLSGIDLSDPRRHDLLLTTQRPTLLSVFRKAGYQTFGLYHAVSWAWPEKSFYGFDVYVDGPALAYSGPAFGFWRIPDQFAVARFDEMHPRSRDTPPRFVLMPTISSHFPFNPVPPYQPDWQRVLSAQPFDESDVQKALTEKTNWLNMTPQYLRSIDYTVRWLSDYLRRPQPRPMVFLLIGDHQPTGNIAGENATWDVPVHVVSSDPDLIARLRKQGFSPGLSPDRTALGGLHDLTTLLLESLRR